MASVSSCMVLFLVFLVSNASAGHMMDYTDLHDTGASCEPRDSCENSFRTFGSTNCECDTLCHRYNDCCIDADQSTSSRMKYSRTCLPYGLKGNGIYVVSKCNRNWRGASDIRQNCEGNSSMEDPMIASPATDDRNSITYKNLYCAECNNANKSYLKSWNIGLVCTSMNNINSTGNITMDFLQQNLVYENSSWGIHYWSWNQSRNIFYPCEIVYNLPEELQDSVRLCRINAKSTCHPSWRQLTVKRQCEAYTAVVYHNNDTYRNPHCARCNFVDLDEVTCTLTLHSRQRPSMSFTLLLDVNMADGNRVGEVNRCSEGKKYDPFARRCRTLVCALPGFTMVEGRCIRQ